MNKISLFLVLILSLPACESSIEACLDYKAVNFRPDADKDCCCEYPQLELELKHWADTIAFSSGSVYHDSAENPFILHDVKCYLSDFQFYKLNNTNFGVKDSLLLNSGRYVKDDFMLSNTDQFKYTIGGITDTGGIFAIKFNVGTGLSVEEYSPANAGLSHALAWQADSLFNSSESYASMMLKIQKDTSNEQLSTFLLYNLNQEIFLDFNTNLNFGYNLKPKVQIDYLKILDGINWQNDSNSLVHEKIENNLNSSFSIIQ